MLFKGNTHSDERGTLQFVNEFNFQNVKRFYSITHPDTSVLRAWQGHKKEVKHFFVTKGAFVVGWVAPDDWENPSPGLQVQKQVLSAGEPAVLAVAAGHANGFRALEPGSTVMVFSSFSLAESAADTFRFKADMWTL